MADNIKHFFFFINLDKLFAGSAYQQKTRVFYEEEIDTNANLSAVADDHRVKVFISHRELFSTHEAIYHAKPVIALPIHTNQPRTAERMASKSSGLHLKWKELTVNLIVQSIHEIISNPR